MDTGHVIALLRPGDPFHEVAGRWATVVREAHWRLVSTAAVLAEIGDEFARDWFRVRKFLGAALVDSSLEIVPVGVELVRRAFDLREQRLDKVWGLTDCISFVVMEDRVLRDALAADRHFEQAGFRVLLRTEPPDRATSRRARM